MRNINGVTRSDEFLKAHPEQDPRIKRKEKKESIAQEPADNDLEPEGNE